MRLTRVGPPKSRVDGDDPLVYTMRDLNKRTTSIMNQVENTGKPAFITRHGRFVAIITPLKSGQIESHVLAEMAREIGESTATRPRPPSSHTRRPLVRTITGSRSLPEPGRMAGVGPPLGRISASCIQRPATSPRRSLRRLASVTATLKSQ